MHRCQRVCGATLPDGPVVLLPHHEDERVLLLARLNTSHLSPVLVEDQVRLGLAATGCAGQLDRLPGAREGVPVGRPQRVAFDADVQGWRTRRT